MWYTVGSARIADEALQETNEIRAVAIARDLPLCSPHTQESHPRPTVRYGTGISSHPRVDT